MAPTPVFKTPEDQAAFFDTYDTTLRKLWPVPYDEITTRSRFGPTHVAPASERRHSTCTPIASASTCAMGTWSMR